MVTKAINALATVCFATGVLVSASTAQATKRDVIVQNNSRFPVYTLTAFPIVFLPNTFNLTPLPLQPRERRVLQVDDIYNRCMFNFVADFRNPRYKGTVRSITEHVPNTQWIESINICATDEKAVLIKRVEPPLRKGLARSTAPSRPSP